MLGETSTRPMAVSVPTIMPSTMPPVLQRFQYSVSSTHGKLAGGRDGERQRHEVRDVLPLGRDADRDGHRADDHRGDARRLDLLLRRHVLAADHADLEVMRHRGGRCQHQPGHHRDDRGEGHRRNERQEQVAEHRVCAAAQRTAPAAGRPCCRPRPPRGSARRRLSSPEPMPRNSVST